MTEIDGSILIGSAASHGPDTFNVADAATGERIEPSFSESTAADVAAACAIAASAFDEYRETSLEMRAGFLEAVADTIAGLGDALIERAMLESGLPRARLEGERARTLGQLRFFAHVVRDGDWLGARINAALPDRTPQPRPDMRLRYIPLGPVAVFGASNFPLAFSVAGGDTASALAAGCPVVVKGHPAHPGTGELVARAIQMAVALSGLPEGVFSFLPGTSYALGAAVVADPRIKAVGFTGSRAGGLALVAIAADRPEPIPVYAEMSSINPVILLPAALAARADALAESFVASLTMGAGQFCTNPGLVLAIHGPDIDRFLVTTARALEASQAAQMLSPAIYGAFEAGVAALECHPQVRSVARGGVGLGATEAGGAVFETGAAAFMADASLGHEVFGASAIVVRCHDDEELRAVVEGLEGQLTATIHLDGADEAIAARLIPLLERKAGRILANGWPTGVEVAHAMVHGGPHPATSDSRMTSVGSLAIDRFLRPVCYQNFPDALLPVSLRDGNPLGIGRRMEGGTV